LRVAILGGAVFAAPAAAQPDDNPPPPPAFVFSIGGGAKAYPSYPGARDLDFRPMLIVQGRREGKPVPLRAPDQNFGIHIFGAKSPVKSGPVVNIQERRRESDVGAAVGNVGWTVEAGGFLEAFVSKNLRVRTELRQGINGHEGMIGEVSGDLFVRAADLTAFSIGPRLRWANDNYVDAYYGVTPRVASATGLAAFDPGSGLHSVGAAAGMRLDVGRGVAVHAYALYDRLMDDVARSPIVARGSPDQFGAGLGLSFSFRVAMPASPERRSPPVPQDARLDNSQ
jgi:outer membrane protein